MELKIGITVDCNIEPDGDGFHAWCPQLPGHHVPGRTRDEALDNAAHAAQAYVISLIKHPNGNRDALLDYLNRCLGYQRFRRITRGALKASIDAHGPITNLNLESATKRIEGLLWAELKGLIEDGGKVNAAEEKLAKGNGTKPAPKGG